MNTPFLLLPSPSVFMRFNPALQPRPTHFTQIHLNFYHTLRSRYNLETVFPGSELYFLIPWQPVLQPISPHYYLNFAPRLHLLHQPPVALYTTAVPHFSSVLRLAGRLREKTLETGYILRWYEIQPGKILPTKTQITHHYRAFIEKALLEYLTGLSSPFATRQLTSFIDRSTSLTLSSLLQNTARLMLRSAQYIAATWPTPIGEVVLLKTPSHSIGSTPTAKQWQQIFNAIFPARNLERMESTLTTSISGAVHRLMQTAKPQPDLGSSRYEIPIPLPLQHKIKTEIGRYYHRLIHAASLESFISSSPLLIDTRSFTSKFTTPYSSLLQATTLLLQSSTLYISSEYETHWQKILRLEPGILHRYSTHMEKELAEQMLSVTHLEPGVVLSKFTTQFSSVLQTTTRLLQSSTSYISNEYETHWQKIMRLEPAILHRYRTHMERELAQGILSVTRLEPGVVVSKFTTQFSSMLQATTRLLQSSTSYIIRDYQTQLQKILPLEPGIHHRYSTLIEKELAERILSVTRLEPGVVVSKFTTQFSLMLQATTRLLSETISNAWYLSAGRQPGDSNNKEWLVLRQLVNDSKANARRAIKSFDQTFSKVWPPAGPPEAAHPGGSISVIRPGAHISFPGYSTAFTHSLVPDYMTPFKADIMPGIMFHLVDGPSRQTFRHVTLTASTSTCWLKTLETRRQEFLSHYTHLLATRLREREIRRSEYQDRVAAAPPYLPGLERDTLELKYTSVFSSPGQPLATFLHHLALLAPVATWLTAKSAAVERKGLIYPGDLVFKPPVSPRSSLEPRTTELSSLIFKAPGNYPYMVHFTPGTLQTSADTVKKIEAALTTRAKQLQADLDRNAASTTKPPDNLSHLADNVYRLIVDRVKKERAMRGY